ncbi:MULTISPECIES: 3-hydroxyacyl-CoA dehydrogenase [Clavibacter]|uniref:3-hydroxyacyl-CoA dehydrogenase n=2 Tax=Clavibacter TaxID=1573 RepID=A0A399NV99_9MICO|nr:MULTISPECIES: 3-hydroxyacyl-CoA dehydrogenase [Clavibacter]KDP92561.1 3-hydroxybutyryl-CoA dehydrogenase [Clavibacter cf. michiganensis LMG 26808]RII98120.1 3-hydroxyacyl-CoA dehydrogenase [Clavibacter michiganensis]UKF25244.1 3-hydroxyacyl-CoA dehydrogenase [Clavibacter sp. A6099]
MPDITKVTVLGAGVLGAQIAFQAANHGKTVTSYDVDDAALEAARGRLDAIVAQFVSESGEETRESATAAAAGIILTSDLAASVADADLVIEAVPERLDLKQDVYRRIADAAPERTVFATNSSTLLPSDIADSTGRPDRFLALHFANHVWVQNTAEIMGTERTSPEVFDRVVAFAEEIGMVPIPLKKEQPGYVLNSLLVPLLAAASGLVLTGVADPKTVDTTWRIATGAPLGPFQIFDLIGLRTAYAVSAASDDPGAQAWAAHLKSEYLDKGKLGRESGEGFYTYG